MTRSLISDSTHGAKQMAKQFTYRGFEYRQEDDGTWSWCDGDMTISQYRTDDEVMEAIDAHKRLQRRTQSTS